MSNYGRITSGGVSLGNVNLEVVKMPAPADRLERSRFIGFALEPKPLQRSLKELDAREIAHGSPIPFTTAELDGTVITPWTTVRLPNVSNDAMVVFLCEYAHDVASQRRGSLDQLRSRNGGSLAVESVREIVIGATDVQKSQEHWQRLLNPRLPSSPGVWQLGAGPAIRVTQADDDGIQEIVVNVSSLAQARGYLQEHDLLGSDRPDELTMTGSNLQGLNIRLVEKDS